jgi:hypothetical protein
VAAVRPRRGLLPQVLDAGELHPVRSAPLPEVRTMTPAALLLLRHAHRRAGTPGTPTAEDWRQLRYRWAVMEQERHDFSHPQPNPKQLHVHPDYGS